MKDSPSPMSLLCRTTSAKAWGPLLTSTARHHHPQSTHLHRGARWSPMPQLRANQQRSPQTGPQPSQGTDPEGQGAAEGQVVAVQGHSWALPALTVLPSNPGSELSLSRPAAFTPFHTLTFSFTSPLLTAAPAHKRVTASLGDCRQRQTVQEVIPSATAPYNLLSPRLTSELRRKATAQHSEAMKHEDRRQQRFLS